MDSIIVMNSIGENFVPIFNLKSISRSLSLDQPINNNYDYAVSLVES